MATLQERKAARKLVRECCRYYIYRGNEHDLFIALPDQEKLQSHFELIFDKYAKEPPAIYFFHRGKKMKYSLTGFPLLTEDQGYYCIQGKFKGNKGLHKIPLHRLAYIAFYGSIPAGFHIHHIDRDKHNNAADNLVALTEDEHCQVHLRDVKVKKNLFSSAKPKGLLQNSAYMADKKYTQDDIMEKLNSPYSEEALANFVTSFLAGVDEPRTILQVMCSRISCTLHEGDKL